MASGTNKNKNSSSSSNKGAVAMNKKKAKPKKSQLLISRFFTSGPVPPPSAQPKGNSPAAAASDATLLTTASSDEHIPSTVPSQESVAATPRARPTSAAVAVASSPHPASSLASGRAKTGADGSPGSPVQLQNQGLDSLAYQPTPELTPSKEKGTATAALKAAEGPIRTRRAQTRAQRATRGAVSAGGAADAMQGDNEDCERDNGDGGGDDRGDGDDDGEGGDVKPVRRRKRRLFVDMDADDESEVERLSPVPARSPSKEAAPSSPPPSKRRRRRAATIPSDPSGDPDFCANDDELHSQSDQEDDTLDVDIRVDDKDVNMAGAEDNGESAAGRDGEVTLASYAHNADGESAALPRDARRRKRFVNRVARLEQNNLFLRYTGGGGNREAADDRTAQVDATSAGAKKSASRGVKYTPLETQFVALRKKHGDMLLVVECGYKYRMFDTDATTASAVLRVASYMDHNFLTASFPTHRLAHHVRRLVEAGNKVGVVSQSETAALKKAGDNSSKLFQRKLSAVYTKGTIAADGKLLSVSGDGMDGGAALGRTTSYILAVDEVSEEGDGRHGATGVVVAAVDCTTGDVVFDGFIDDVLRSSLESRIVSLDPVELVLPHGIMSKQTETVVKALAGNTSARVERMAAGSFEASDKIGTLGDGVTSVLGKGLIGQGVLRCIGALLRYLKTFSLELSLTRVLEFKSFSTRAHMRVGADVLRSFEVFGNSNDGGVDGSLIGLMNRATTPFGRRRMRKWVSQPLVDAVEIRSRLEAVDYLKHVIDGACTEAEGEGIDSAMADLVAHLAKVPDVERGLTRISCGKCTPSEVVAVLEAMENVGKRTDRVKRLKPSAEFPELLKGAIERMPIVQDVVENPVVTVLKRPEAVEGRYAELFEGGDMSVEEALSDVNGTEEFVGKVAEVEMANADLVEAEEAMNTLLNKLRRKHSRPKWVWKKVAQEEYLLEVEKAKAGSMPNSWTIVCQTKAVKRFRPEEAEKGMQQVLCARERRDAVCKECWQAYVELLAGMVTGLRGVVRALVEVDCLASLARVAQLPGYCKPVIVDGDAADGGCGLKVVNGRHALTELLSSCASYVPNDVDVGTGETQTRGVVISGPNYGGKSSYVRMCALLAMMAQMGSFVPAEAVEIAPFDAMFARMGAADCMVKGMSSLMMELAETSRILVEATDKSLVILDELGRGTSTHDGAAIAYTTMEHLVREVRCVTMFVTHYPMLAGLTRVLPRWVDACFMDYREEKRDGGEDEGRKRITLLYKVTRGVAPSSYGLNVARLAGVPQTVLDEALRKATTLQESMDDERRDNRWGALLSPSRWRNDDGVRILLGDIVERSARG